MTDKIISKTSNERYREEFDRIFRGYKPTETKVPPKDDPEKGQEDHDNGD